MNVLHLWLIAMGFASPAHHDGIATRDGKIEFKAGTLATKANRVVATTDGDLEVQRRARGSQPEPILPPPDPIPTPGGETASNTNC